MCRCAERRGRIVQAAQAVARGDLEAAKEAASFVVSTSVSDIRKSASLAAARARLKR